MIYLNKWWKNEERMGKCVFLKSCLFFIPFVIDVHPVLNNFCVKGKCLMPVVSSEISALPCENLWQI